MESPFPGMDPYLEDREFWVGFHNLFAAEITRALNQHLPDGYYAQIEKQSVIEFFTNQEPGAKIVPDALIVTPMPPALGQGQPGMTAQLSPSYLLSVEPFVVELAYVEVHSIQAEHKVVTAFEIISPSNKRTGKDRAAYLKKRDTVLNSNTSLIEIDLLQNGLRFGLPDLEPKHEIPQHEYQVLISRYWQRFPRFQAELYPISIQEKLPTIAVPLHQDDPESFVDLQQAFESTYSGGTYRRGAIDYSKPPRAQMSEQTMNWVCGRLGIANNG